MQTLMTKKDFVKEINEIIDLQEQKNAIEKSLEKYNNGATYMLPDVNEERSLRFLSALIGLGSSTDSPLLDWYYSPFREGRLNNDFWVAFGPVGDKQLLQTPEQFYDFYVVESRDEPV